MGLRDRLKQGLKRALGAPVDPPPPRAYVERSPPPAPSAAPPAPDTSQPKPPAPVAIAPAPVAVAAPAPVVVAAPVPLAIAPAPVVAVAAPTPVVDAVPAPAAAPPADPAPASPLPKNFLSDNDAPLRDAHLRGTFSTTENAFTVRLVNEALGLDLSVPCEPGEFVLEAADRAGHELPASCRNGGCLTCAGRLVTGDTEMEEQYTLEEEHVANGFRLLCCTRVRSDAVFVTHQQDDIH